MLPAANVRPKFVIPEKMEKPEEESCQR